MEGMWFFDPASDHWFGRIEYQDRDTPWCLVARVDPVTGDYIHHRWVPYTAVAQWHLYSTKEEALRAYEREIGA